MRIGGGRFDGSSAGFKIEEDIAGETVYGGHESLVPTGVPSRARVCRCAISSFLLPLFPIAIYALCVMASGDEDAIESFWEALKESMARVTDVVKAAVQAVGMTRRPM